LGYENFTVVNGYSMISEYNDGTVSYILEKKFAGVLDTGNETLNVYYSVVGEIIENIIIADESSLYLLETPSIGLRTPTTNVSEGLDNETVKAKILELIGIIEAKITKILDKADKIVRKFVNKIIKAINKDKTHKIEKIFKWFNKKVVKLLKHITKIEVKIDLLYNLTKQYEMENYIRDEVIVLSDTINARINKILERTNILEEHKTIFERTLEILTPLLGEFSKIDDMLLNVVHETVTYVYAKTEIGLNLVIVIDGGGIGSGTNPGDYSNHNKNVESYVLVDEEFRAHINTDIWQDWYIKTVYIFEEADNPFESKFGINFVAMEINGRWNSPNTTTYIESLYANAKSFVNWNVNKWNYEALIVLTEQNTRYSIYNEDVSGMCWKWDTERGLVAETIAYGVNVLQHEESHLYYAPDHDPGYTKFCIMSYAWMWIARNWCDECTSIINSHKYRF